MIGINNVAVISWVPNVVCLVLGIVIVLGTASSVMRSLIVTRGLRSVLVNSVSQAVRIVIIVVARRFKKYETRDSIQSWMVPVGVIATLGTWLLLFLLGYSLILTSSSALDFLGSVREAGSSLFTLGFASSDRTQLTIVDFIAAATGPVVIGLMISYLPTLYAAYSRREMAVALLKPMAGEPNWAPELLARETLVGVGGHKLTEIWADWEKWSADVAESHTTYPMLIFTRSAKPTRNWLVSLLTVMDSAALTLALNPSMQQAPARMLLRQGVECVHSLARVTRIEFDSDAAPGTPTQLQKDDFLAAIAMLDEVGYKRERNPDEAWTHFQQWRVVYEAPIYELLMLIDAVPAYWSGPRKPPTPPMESPRPRYIVNNPDGSIGPPAAWRRPKPKTARTGPRTKKS